MRLAHGVSPGAPVKFLRTKSVPTLAMDILT
uniref:Uncharacterized protein n=1 Tax=Globisporangium ultimum (strain ATCC 200006 / CBS 805.95 / DAOM BR144) TaxID=431595 RepID=K3X7X5_GLOUD